MKTIQDWKDLFSDGVFNETYLSHVEKLEKEYHSYLEFDPRRGAELSGRHTRRDSVPDTLMGIPFAVKDNIAVENFHLTCGSRILENFISPYSATAVEKLMARGAVPVGKTNMDEFGMGSSTDDSALGVTNNPWDTQRVVGGSSGGSAAAVAAGLAAFSLGSDTGGSVRQPACFCGVYGLKPTYGVVSRYGLVAYASSLEVIGAMARDIELLEQVFTAMRGRDPRDNTSVAHPEEGMPMEGINSGGVIGVLSGDLGLDPQVKQAYHAAVLSLKDLGFQVKEITLPTLEYVVPAYYTIATAEASANLARYNGIKYGLRIQGAQSPDDLVLNSRHEGFGPEVKLRILLGTYVLRSGFQDRYYIRAQKIRTAIREDFDRVFKETQAVMMPVFPTQAFKHGSAGLDPFQQKLADRFTGTANLAALPALSVPTGLSSGLPTGVQFMAPAFKEGRLFSLAREFAKIYPVPVLPGTGGEGR